MRAMVKLIVVGLLVFVFSPLVQAQEFSPTTYDQTVTIDRHGNSLLNGQKSADIKLEIHPDKSVWRYLALNESGEFITDLTVTVRLPEKLHSTKVTPKIYAVHGVDSYETIILDQSTIQFRAANIGGSASLTFTLEIPSGSFDLNSNNLIQFWIQKLPVGFWLTIALLLPILILLYIFKLFTDRRQDILLKPDPRAQAKVPSQLSPALVGILINGYVGMREIAATIIDLAKRGYIDIIYRADGDFAFSQKGAWQTDPKLQVFERYFLSQLFNSTQPISDEAEINKRLNKTVWSESMSQVVDQMYDQMFKLGYFPENPKEAHLKVRFVGILIFFSSVAGLALNLVFFKDQSWAALPWVVTLVISPIITRAALLVPKRTVAGRSQAAQWLAFKRDLSLSESGKFSQDSKLFEQNLAYAIALKVEQQWVGRFVGMPFRLPDWFYSHSKLIDNYVDFADALFSIVGYLGQKLSLSRKPSVL